MKRFFALLCAAAVLAGCASGTESGSAPAGEPVSVVATAYPLFDVAATIGGERVEAHNLLPLNALDNEPLGDDEAERLRSADLAVILGRRTQPEVEIVAAQRSGPTIRVLELLRGIPATGGYERLGVDPFVWLDTGRMATIIDAVEEALTAADPAGVSDFEKNARNYGRTVAAIDRNFSRTLARCDRVDVHTTDPAFRYLTERYGLRQVAISGFDDAPRGHTAFAAELPPVDVARRLLDDHDVRVAVLDPLVNQTDQARRGGAGYANVMALNLDALRAGLGCAD